MTEQNQPNAWIHSPKVDLSFFSLTWLFIFGAYLVVDQTAWKGQGRMWILYLTLLVTVFHRHLTFPLVYGDPEVLEARKKTYLLLPVFLFLLTAVSLLYVREPHFTTTPLTQPIRFDRSESLMVYLREGKKIKNVRVHFTGEEKTPPEVAQTFETAMGGRLSAKAEGDQLRFFLPAGSPFKKFSFGSFHGHDLQQRLGLPKISRVGWKREKPLFLLLVIASALWNFWHTLMQKLGILRVYSRKAGYGKSWLDRSMVWVWFGWLFCALAASPEVRRKVSHLGSTGKFLTNSLEPLFQWAPFLAKGFLAFALTLTAVYIFNEFRNRRRFHWPKNIFLISILGIYSIFFYDFLVGYVTFGFSHAVEYLAFVNIYSRRKYGGRPAATSLMARWIRHQGRNFLIFVGVSSLIFIPWFRKDPITLNWYIVATSFMHFLYDGWIWKIRKPEVGASLGIQYSPQVTAA